MTPMASEDYTAPKGQDLDIGAQIRLWRKHLGLSQGDLENLTGLAHNAISRIERGSVSPRIETVERIARALQLSVEEIQFRKPSGDSNETERAEPQDLIDRLALLEGKKRQELLEMFHRMIDLADSEQ